MRHEIMRKRAIPCFDASVSHQAKYRTHLTQKEKKTKRLFLKGNTSEFTHRKSGNQKKRSIQSSKFV